MTESRLHSWRTRAAGRVLSSRRSARPSRTPRSRRPLLRATFILTTLMLVGVVGTAITLYAKGYRVWVVHTGSMEPTYVPGDLIVDRPPSGQYHPGEVITFRHSSLTTDVVTHRVTVVREDGLINTKGDANRTADVWNIRPDQVQGSVQFRLKGVGYLVAFLKQPTGIWAIGSLAVGLVLLWQLFFPPTDTGAAPQKRRPGAQPATV